MFLINFNEPQRAIAPTFKPSEKPTLAGKGSNKARRFSQFSSPNRI